MNDTVIRTRALSHKFGTVTALDHVDLTVASGQVYGFLGRNGAGKTTLIRALLGLFAPTDGEVEVLGTLVRAGRTPAQLWAQVGYLVEGPGLYPGVTVTEHLRIATGYHGHSPAAVTAVLDRLDLTRYAEVRAGVLSMGNRQRLGLALALVHRPPLLVLDEPVNGLDPAGVVDIRNLLRELADGGTTVFMSTHLITEVARLADRVGIIHEGRLIRELDGDHLGDEGERLVATFRTHDLARHAVAALARQDIDADLGMGPAPTMTSTSQAALLRPDDVVTLLVRKGLAPLSFQVETEDLEQLFLHLTGNATIAGSAA